jgi:ABC-type lipoprotein release transport system permease subunit
LLRASGVRLGELRRIVLLETGVPMIFTCMLGVALGMVTSYAFQTLEGASWNPPASTSSPSWAALCSSPW